MLLLPIAIFFFRPSMTLSHLAPTVGGNTPLDKRAACPETTLTSITLQKAPARRGITPTLWIMLKSTSKVCKSGSLLKFQRKARPTVSLDAPVPCKTPIMRSIVSSAAFALITASLLVKAAQTQQCVGESLPEVLNFPKLMRLSATVRFTCSALSRPCVHAEHVNMDR